MVSKSPSYFSLGTRRETAEGSNLVRSQMQRPHCTLWFSLGLWMLSFCWIVFNFSFLCWKYGKDRVSHPAVAVPMVGRWEMPVGERHREAGLFPLVAWDFFAALHTVPVVGWTLVSSGRLASRCSAWECVGVLDAPWEGAQVGYQMLEVFGELCQSEGWTEVSSPSLPV